MAVTRYLARDLAIDINTGTEGSPTWTPIGGLNNITHADASVDADTTGFDSNGMEEHQVAQRGHSWTLAGYSLEDVANGNRDPGQAAVEALGKQIGPASIGQFKVTSPGGNEKIFKASAKVTLAGGGNNDPANWSATLKASGMVTDA